MFHGGDGLRKSRHGQGGWGRGAGEGEAAGSGSRQVRGRAGVGEEGSGQGRTSFIASKAASTGDSRSPAEILNVVQISIPARVRTGPQQPSGGLHSWR